MAIRKGDKIIHELKAMHEHPRGVDLSGSVYKGKIGLYFFRANDRYSEMNAGIAGRNYAICLEWSQISYLFYNDVDYIFIKTQYDIWNILVSDFIEHLIQIPRKPEYVYCSEIHFAKKDREDKLSDKPGGYKNDIPTGTRGKADNIEQLAKQIHKRAERNAKEWKKKNEDLFGKKEEKEPKPKYKPGEQIGLF